MDEGLVTEVVADALCASIRDDEPNWATQRNWDAGDGLIIRRHAENVATALRDAPGVAIATVAPADEPGTIRVKVAVDPDELRFWAGKHADAGHNGVAHALYEAADLYTQLDQNVR